MTLADQLRPNARIGNEAGWLLVFDRVRGPRRGKGYPSIGSDRFYADIKASLPSGLGGGTYTFVIEALPDDLYDQVRQGKDDSPQVVCLYLFWHEVLTGITGHFKNLAGLTGSASGLRTADIGEPVAFLSIVKVSRKAGARHYETIITARERVFERLARVPLCGEGIEADTPEAALATLQERLLGSKGLEFRGLQPSPDRPPAPSAEQGDTKVRLEAGRTADELLASLAESMEQRTNRYGRGMLLIRDGVLHVGTRPIPFNPSQPQRKPADAEPELGLATGLVEIEALEAVPTDPSFDRCPPEGAPLAPGQSREPPTRRQFRLTLKGRPDLKPGDVARFAAPATESATTPRPFGLLSDLNNAPLLPSLDGGAGEQVRLYVHGVEHALSRTSGFTTTVTGVELVNGQDAWDAHTPRRRTEEPEQPAADPVTDAARAVHGAARRIVGSRRFPEIGEVRLATPAGTGEPPGQTELVWRGLAAPDGRGHQSRRLEIDRERPSPIGGVAYASPFAWGSCGLVLPRYPGTRVLLVHRDGQADDPVEVGALWASGHGPSAEAGDWWLILPAGVPEENRASIPDTKVPEDYTGKATNDLIDAEGNRCIEVGRLTVRVGKDGLKQAGRRPAAGDEADFVAIEHADGQTKLLIRQDGTIELHAKKNIELTADGDITLDATNVNVRVDNVMKVE